MAIRDIIPKLMGSDDPQPNAGEHKLLTSMRAMAREARSAWDTVHFDIQGGQSRAGSLLSAWEVSGRHYKGFQWEKKPRQGLAYFTDNRTTNAIEAAVANQFGDGIRVKFAPVESGEITGYGLQEKAGKALAAAAEADPEGVGTLIEGLSPQQMAGVEMISEAQADALRGLTEDKVNPETGEVLEPAVFDDDDMVKMNDALFAKVMSDIWSVQFNNALGDFYMLQSETFSSIYGHCGMLYEWDAEHKQMCISNPHILSVLPDPKATNIKEMEYLIYDQKVSVEEAISLYPDREKEIKANATTGVKGEHTDGTMVETSTNHIQYERDMVVLSTMWQRHHTFPMETYEAVAAGLVEEATIEADAETGEVLSKPYVLTQKGADKTSGPIGSPIAPNDPEWPKTHGIRQVVAIVDADIILENIRCPFIDIPWGWNVNLPLPWSPYGMGEPMKTKDVQLAINRLFSAIYNVILYNQSPQQIISVSMETAMKQKGTSLHARPDKVMVVDDTIYLDMVQRGGVLTIDPPQVPGAWIKLWEMLLNEHDVLSANSAVNQGRAPFAQASGSAINALQQGTSALMSVRGRFTEWTLEHIAKLCVDSVVKWFDADDYRKYVEKYPPVVLTMAQKRIKSMKFDTTAIVTGGRGPNRQAVHAAAREDFKIGLLSRESALEELDRPDPKQESEKIQEDLEAQAPEQPTQ